MRLLIKFLPLLLSILLPRAQRRPEVGDQPPKERSEKLAY